ncbi:hypothetical protein SAMN05216352_103125 [Alteribacillus bidgolensis]|uniref:Uncharacterized protein n=1 Tax=Alteribacillus bidgolensis TaxID=930129 RepID=A0A1G8FX06_9BACI|nr:hypothetical protein SAMN05216352_103125 [Alteribacillus bidgolensis]
MDIANCSSNARERHLTYKVNLLGWVKSYVTFVQTGY